MELNYANLTNLKGFLESFLDVRSRSFSYAVERNISKVESAIKAGRKWAYSQPAFERNPDFDKYIKKYMVLEQEHAQRDESNSILRDESGVIMPKDEKLWKEKLAELDATYTLGETILENRRAVLRELDDKVYDIEFYKLQSEDALPQDISARERIGLRFMLDEALIPEEAQIKKDEEGEEGKVDETKEVEGKEATDKTE